jgi:hypothetical protein
MRRLPLRRCWSGVRDRRGDRETEREAERGVTDLRGVRESREPDGERRGGGVLDRDRDRDNDRDGMAITEGIIELESVAIC